MGRQHRQDDIPRGAFRFAAATDSMVLDDRYVADALEKPDRDPAWVPRVIIGVRNGLLLSAALWAAIIGLIVWLA
jgi:hypothetical protein